MSTDPILEFYTDHPYPPPLENLDRALELWKGENILRAEFHLLWPEKEYRADLDVLVAGCGTWQAARYALTHPAARVTAIDISPTSLAHTERLKQKHELTNIETRQLAIENVAELDHRFDHIICTGVLHHLVDPDAGLRALRSVLKPDGAMYLMLYGLHGRSGIYMIQEYCRRLGIGTTREEIEELIGAVRHLPQFHPLIGTLRGDTGSLNAVVLTDLLLNPRERAYTVPELLDFLERSDLKLGRWYWQAAYLPQCGGISKTTHAKKIAALPEREQYAAMELWRGLMQIHSIAALPSDYSGGKVRFDDESYLRYVPIRMGFTVCSDQQLPPGAAGILINQTHVFNDLYVVLDPKERQIFDAIDGQRSIAEIVESVEGSSSRAREFFEKLWRHDQLVFDISHSI